MGGWIQGKSEYKSTISKEITYFHSDSDTLIIQNAQIIIYNNYGTECDNWKRWKGSPEEHSFNDLPSIRCWLLLLLLLRILCIFCCLHSLHICCCRSSIAAHLQQTDKWYRISIGATKKKKTFVIGGAAANDEVAKQEQFKQFKKMLLLHSLKV